MISFESFEYTNSYAGTLVFVYIPTMFKFIHDLSKAKQGVDMNLTLLEICKSRR